MTTRRTLVFSAWTALGLAASASAQLPAGTSFTYQGRLEDGGTPATGSYDFEFRLFAAAAGGTQVGATVARPGVVIAAGLFTVDLDFGNGVFTGDALWLELAVRPAGGGPYTTLSPRQRTTSAPYAIHALSIPVHDHVGQAWTTDSATYGLAVTNTSSVASGAALRGVHAGTSGASYAVQGVNLQELSGAVGVLGLAAGSSGTTYGVYGLVGSNSGWGLFTPNDASIGGSLSLGSASTPAARLDVTGQGRFAVASGTPPFLLPTAYAPGATVANLSADRLDGLDSSSFSTSVHTHDAADLASGTIASARVSGAYTGITGLGTVGAGTWSASPIGPLFGGTGQTSWAAGDLLFASAANTLARLPVGTAGQMLSVSSGLPTWAPAGNHDHLGQTWTTASDLNALNLVNNSSSGGGSALRAARGGAAPISGTAIDAINSQAVLGATAIRGDAIDASALNFGVYGLSSSSNGRGVTGVATATSGQAIGVFGQSGSPAGWGFFTANNSFVGGSLRVGLDGPPSARLDVVGQARVQAPSATPPLIVPTAYAAGANVTNLSADRLDGLDSTDFAPAIHDHVGESWSVTSESIGLSVTRTAPTTGAALRGVHSGPGPGWAVQGINSQGVAGAAGVYGSATSTTGFAVGVLGESLSDGGTAVLGQAFSTTGVARGVIGTSASTAGFGVIGAANGSTGVNYGVYGSSNSSTGFGLFTPNRAQVGDSLTVLGLVGIGTTAPSAQLDVERSGLPVAEFNRTTSDGAVINIAQDGVVEGNISVAGTTVSYNAFTGSHYGWTDQTIERGMLVSLTGENRRLHGRDDAEPIYGIALAGRANDPAVLGSYLGRLEPGEPARPANENPHLVAAVGNGEMWVVETGGDIEPGDALIASATPGHAMRDDDHFEVSHVVARAAERVRWREVTDRLDGARRRLISVLFESHDRESTSALRAALDRSTRELVELRSALTAQSSRLEVLEAALAGGDRKKERRVAAAGSATGER